MAASGSELITVLVAGLLLALGFQLLLTNVGALAGLLLLPVDKTVEIPSSPNLKNTSQTRETRLPLGLLTGLGLILGLNSALVPAAFLAVTLSRIQPPLLGAIAGLVLWAAYWLLLVWVSVQTVSALSQRVLQVVFGSVASLQQLTATIGRWLGGRGKRDRLDPPDRPDDWETAFSQAIADLETDLLAKLTAQTHSPDRDRGDTSPADGLKPKTNPARANLSATLTADIPQPSAQTGPPGSQLVRQLVQRVDLADVDLWALWQRLSGSDLAPSWLPADVEAYLTTAAPWALKPAALAEEMAGLLWDEAADPAAVRQQLEQLDPETVVGWLLQRGDMNPQQAQNLAAQLEQLRQAAVQKASRAVAALASPTPDPASPDEVNALQEKLVAYLRYTSLDKLSPAGVDDKLHSLLEASSAPPAALGAALPKVVTPELGDILARRRGLASQRRDELILALEDSWQQLTEPAPADSSDGLGQLVKALQTGLQQAQPGSVLQQLQPGLTQLLDNQPLAQARQLLQTDWSPVIDLLTERLPKAEAEALVDWIKAQLYRLARWPRRWLTRLQGQPGLPQIQRYVKYQDSSALVPDQIEQDLRSLLATKPTLDWQPVSAADMAVALSQRGDLAADDITELAETVRSRWQAVLDSLDPLPEAIADTFTDGTPDIDWQQWTAALRRLPGFSAEAVSLLRQRLGSWGEQILDQYGDLPAAAQAALGNQIQRLQSAATEQIDQLEQDVLAQAEQLRQGAAMAVLWLLLIALSAAAGATAAGYWASRWQI